jgi:hypothetical protein
VEQREGGVLKGDSSFIASVTLMIVLVVEVMIIVVHSQNDDILRQLEKMQEGYANTECTCTMQTGDPK